MLTESQLLVEIARMSQAAQRNGLFIVAALVAETDPETSTLRHRLVVHPGMTLEALELVRDHCDAQLGAVRFTLTGE